jgi:hypothetical protein
MDPMLGKLYLSHNVDHKPFTVTLVVHIFLATQNSLERRDSSSQARFTIGTFETCMYYVPCSINLHH